MVTNLDETSRFLGKVPLFKGLKDRQLRRLAERVRERDYKEGDVIVEQGSMGVGLFIIASGECRVMRSQPDASVRELDRLSRTDFFGELSLLDDSVRNASVIAETEMRCFILYKLDFLDELQQEPEMAIEMLKELAHRFRRIVASM